jgi:hypothetical protein
MSDRSLSTPSAPLSMVRSAGGKMGKAVGIGCLGMIIMVSLCSAPLWFLGWFGSGDDQPTTKAPSVIRVQPINCGPNEWPMQWYANGVQHSACTPKW